MGDLVRAAKEAHDAMIAWWVAHQPDEQDLAKARELLASRPDLLAEIEELNAPIPPAPAPLERVQQAQRIVDDAMARHQLRASDVQRLRELREQNPEDADFRELRDEIIAAINEQRLVPEPGSHEYF